jgi:hypothetical protein
VAVGEKAKGQSLLVAPHLPTDNLGIHEQPGKQLTKLHVMGALAKLPGLIDAAIKDPDVRVAAQQVLSGGRSNAEQDAPDGRHDLALDSTYRCGLHLHQGIPSLCWSARRHERVGR